MLDEVAFWRDENSAKPDEELYRAITPALATLNGKIVGISSPYRKSGLLHSKFKKHFAKDGDILFVKAPTRVLNPAAPQTHCVQPSSQGKRHEVLRGSGAERPYYGQASGQQIRVRWPHGQLAKDQDLEAPGSGHSRIHGPQADATFLWSAALALREKDGWRYIGHVGTGFSHKTLGELHGKLVKLKSGKSSFPAKVKDEGVTTWVKPSLVAEVKFTEWTSSGEMRHPVYLGLRTDKRAEDVTREREKPRK